MFVGCAVYLISFFFIESDGLIEGDSHGVVLSSVWENKYLKIFVISYNHFECSQSKFIKFVVIKS